MSLGVNPLPQTWSHIFIKKFESLMKRSVTTLLILLAGASPRKLSNVGNVVIGLTDLNMFSRSF